MATSIIENFYFGETTLTNFITNEVSFQKGFYSISFSEMNSTLKPVIQLGSSIEIDGDLYYFNANETISLTPSVGICYVKTYVSASNAIAEMTNINPIFDSLKNGWYGSGASASHRYILKLYYDGSDYTLKQIMEKERYWIYEI